MSFTLVNSLFGTYMVQNPDGSRANLVGSATTAKFQPGAMLIDVPNNITYWLPGVDTIYGLASSSIAVPLAGDAFYQNTVLLKNVGNNTFSLFANPNTASTIQIDQPLTCPDGSIVRLVPGIKTAGGMKLLQYVDVFAKQGGADKFLARLAFGAAGNGLLGKSSVYASMNESQVFRTPAGVVQVGTSYSPQTNVTTISLTQCPGQVYGTPTGGVTSLSVHHYHYFM